VDIAHLQTERAYQTVANEVAVAYYQVLRTRSLRRIAAEAVRRGEDDLDVARKLARGGVVEREKVLRAQVALAKEQRLLDLAEGAEAVAVAGLNLAIGFNVSAPTCIVDTSDVPPFNRCLADCLRAAVASATLAARAGRPNASDTAPATARAPLLVGGFGRAGRLLRAVPNPGPDRPHG
jgi:outer membrane protein TolC